MALTSKTIGYGDGLFHEIPYSVLGGVSLFRVSGVDERDVRYSSVCLPNQNAMRAATLPKELVSHLCTVPVEPVPHWLSPFGSCIRQFICQSVTSGSACSLVRSKLLR
jgi:hypothetical protein